MKSRREFIASAAAVGLMSALAPEFVTAASLNSPMKGKRALRIAHITDVHLLDKVNAKNCYSRVLSEFNALKDKPDFIINTGDSVMDENAQTLETVGSHWNVWNEVTRGSNRLDIFSALGNHDVWYGPDAILDAEYKKDKRYGKQWAIDSLKLPARYYTFTAKGWKFIALDSINGTGGYQLDDEQFAWLERELSNATMPVMIYNHVPILSMSALLYTTRRKPLSEVTFPTGSMHNDHQRVKDLFHKTKKARVCLSGHMHYVDSVEYLGVKYLCNGAVSGNWWGEPLTLEEFPPAYSIVDLFEDGTCTQQLVAYNTQFN